MHIWLYTSIYWRRKWQPTPVFLPGESQGQRSQAGYSQWGRKSWAWLSNYTTTTVYIHIPSLLSLSPHPPAYPSRSSQSSWLGSPCYIATFHYLSYTWWGIYVNAISQFIPPSPSPAESTSLFSTWLISTIFYIPYICINIWNLFFSFWLTSLCMENRSWYCSIHWLKFDLLI